MTKQQKLDAIYEAMADKTLSDGCKFAYEGYLYVIGNAILNRDLVDISWQSSSDIYSVATKDITIIGHPVRIGDVLDYIDSLETWLDGKDKESWRLNVFSLLLMWENKKLPIDDQSEDCIDFVYSLISK